MNICILDAYTTNPGDLNWDALQSLGNLRVYQKTAASEVYERARDAEILLTNKVVLDRKMIESLPRLQYIGVLATGYNVVDLQAARERGIPVCNVPAYCTRAVAQLVFALLLELTNHVQKHSESVRAGDWASSDHFCYWNFPLVELENKTMGIFGYGNIGKAVADIALAMGMNVLVSSRTPKDLPQGCKWVPQEVLFAESDVISLHCPLTEETKELVNADLLSKMKRNAFLINTARGGVIHEKDLAQALNEGRISGAGLDVLSTEPPKADNPLLSAKNCIITPHIAWATAEARSRLIATVTQNVKDFLDGHPNNVVNT